MFVPCPTGRCFDENHLVMVSAGGGDSLCGRVVTQAIDHGPQGLLEISAYTLGLAMTALSLPVKLVFGLR
jgi:hypothetical protein